MISEIVYISWMSVLFYILLGVIGYVVFLYNKTNYNHIYNPQTESKMILQITTIGNDTVNTIIDRMRSYKLPIEIWVAKEYFDQINYPDADKIIVIPEEFHPKNIKIRTKATSLEYTRLLRKHLVEIGQLNPNYRIVFIDDDSVPSKEFLLDCIATDYDILEGVITPINKYGTVLSYLDNIRCYSCYFICATFQGLNIPVWIHGEGMFVKAWVEQKTTWDHKYISSEDLVFGQLSIQNGAKMGFTYSPIMITNPLSIKDSIMQRRRWVWGNFNAMRNLLPFNAVVRLVFFWAIGMIIFAVSTAGAIIHLFGYIELTTTQAMLTYWTLALWFISWGYIGYKNSCYLKADTYHTFKHTVISAIFAYPCVTLNFISQSIGVLRGAPAKFEVIKKEV